jgi:HNH endonuclease
MKAGLRFRVLERDNYTCRYCGATPPAARLEVDHVVPKSLGGSDDLVNLVTSCSVCNNGKHDRPTKGAPSRCSECQGWTLGGRCVRCVLDGVGCGISDTLDALADRGNSLTEYEMGMWDGLQSAMSLVLGETVKENTYGPPESRQ